MNMSDVFNLPVSCEEVAEIGTEIFLGNEDAYAAHAINSHDALKERVKELEEALRLQVIDSKKVIDNLCNTGCDEAWSIIKLNNMITDANDALEKE